MRQDAKSREVKVKASDKPPAHVHYQRAVMVRTHNEDEDAPILDKEGKVLSIDTYEIS